MSRAVATRRTVRSTLWYSALFQTPQLHCGYIGATCLGQGCQAATLREAEDFPHGRNVTQWGIVEDLLIARGNHSLKLGVNFRRDDVVPTDRLKIKIPNVATM
jgi:hypothetical protein